MYCIGLNLIYCATNNACSNVIEITISSSDIVIDTWLFDAHGETIV